MKIGVFDSGIGGLSVARAIERALPELEVVYKNDSEHVPYGSRRPSELLSFVTPIVQQFIDEDCQIIVIACNTVSTLLIAELRSQFTVPFVAIEPMVKTGAARTKSGIIAVCATPATLASVRYKQLKTYFASTVQVLEPDCSDWSCMIEHNHIDDQKIAERIYEVLDEGADVIVLGCTHYHWIQSKIVKMCDGKASVIQPEEAIIRQLKRVIQQIP